MVEWTVDAVKAASKIVHENIRWREGGVGIKDSDLRASLDAAVKAQGIDPPDLPTLCAFEAGKDYARAEALEEAAKVARRFTLMEKPPSHWPTELAEATAFICGKAGGQIANAIVALKDKPANQMDGGE